MHILQPERCKNIVKMDWIFDEFKREEQQAINGEKLKKDNREKEK